MLAGACRQPTTSAQRRAAKPTSVETLPAQALDDLGVAPAQPAPRAGRGCARGTARGRCRRQVEDDHQPLRVHPRAVRLLAGFVAVAMIPHGCCGSETQATPGTFVPRVPLTGRTGRPGGIRTPNTRFWRPLLYRWSYWPTNSLDLAFFVVRVLAARAGRTCSARACPGSSACSSSWCSSAPCRPCTRAK